MISVIESYYTLNQPPVNAPPLPIDSYVGTYVFNSTDASTSNALKEGTTATVVVSREINGNYLFAPGKIKKIFLFI